MHQLGVENRRAGSAANGVVAQGDELVVEYRTAAKATDGHRPAAGAIPVGGRLRPVVLRQVNDRLLWRRWQIVLLRLAAKPVPRRDNRLGIGPLLERDGNRRRV